jgi:hypothetical protein
VKSTLKTLLKECCASPWPLLPSWQSKLFVPGSSTCATSSSAASKPQWKRSEPSPPTVRRCNLSSFPPPETTGGKQPSRIKITQAHILAEAWKDHDPAALAVSEKINLEVKNRYGLDTSDLQGDAAYLQDNLTMQQQRDGTLQTRYASLRHDPSKFVVSEAGPNDSNVGRDISKSEASALIENTAEDQKKQGGWGALDDIQGFVGKDAEVDQAIKAKFPDLLTTTEQRKARAKEHLEAMELVIAAQTEQIKRHGIALHDEMKRHRVPPAYLASDEMVAALQASKEAAGTDTAPDADRGVAERAHLID